MRELPSELALELPADSNESTVADALLPYLVSQILRVPVAGIGT